VSNEYKPPFPWFGGKSAVADKVWAAMGDVTNYVEPFFGSGAVLFLRPGGAGKTETINDADGFVANFWRALLRDPDAVTEHADNPVNEADLHARHLWLNGQRERITERLMGDPDFFDAKAAGWWCWGACCWIGSGWCSGQGPWHSVDGVMVKGDGDGTGVSRAIPHLGDAGRGVSRQLPQLRNAGQGVNRQIPRDMSKGARQDRRENLRAYLGEFADRLARVRVCCGDWSRVCGTVTTVCRGTTGVFLDPPYADSAGRDKDLYAIDCGSVSHAVKEWAIEQGASPLMRIVMAGYEGEHAAFPPGWRTVEWKAHGGYANLSTDEEATGRVNAKRERLWLSPHCVKTEGGLWD